MLWIYFLLIFAVILYFKYSKNKSDDMAGWPKLPGKVTKIVFGLGNPGSFYEHHRHNVGKLFINHLVHKYGSTLVNTKAGDLGFIKNRQNQYTAIIKSPSYMNLSGQPFKFAVKYCGVTDIKNCIIVHDDLDNPVGKCKLKDGGSPEGHNGLKSIIENMGSKDFKRIKFGISRPNTKEPSEVAKYVCADFPSDDFEKFKKEIFDKGIELLKQQEAL